MVSNLTVTLITSIFTHTRSLSFLQIAMSWAVLSCAHTHAIFADDVASRGWFATEIHVWFHELHMRNNEVLMKVTVRYLLW